MDSRSAVRLARPTVVCASSGACQHAPASAAARNASALRGLDEQRVFAIRASASLTPSTAGWRRCPGPRTPPLRAAHSACLRRPSERREYPHDAVDIPARRNRGPPGRRTGLTREIGRIEQLEDSTHCTASNVSPSYLSPARRAGLGGRFDRARRTRARRSGTFFFRRSVATCRARSPHSRRFVPEPPLNRVRSTPLGMNALRTLDRRDRPRPARGCRGSRT